MAAARLILLLIKLFIPPYRRFLKRYNTFVWLFAEGLVIERKKYRGLFGESSWNAGETSALPANIAHAAHLILKTHPRERVLFSS